MGRKKNKVKRQKVPKYDLPLSKWKNLSTKEKELYLRGRNRDNGIGWSPLEAAVFYLVLKKYGCGNWDLVSYYLPHQNTAQFNTFCQKLFGQQSLYAFSGLRVDPYDNFVENAAKLGLRKNGVRVHEGVPMSTKAKRAMKDDWRKKEHVKLYDIPVIEDRSQNYTKLWWQMESTLQLVKDEANNRGLYYDPNLGPDHHKLVDHKKWMDQPFAWPKPTKWQIDKEFGCLKGANNEWPLIRMVEDEDWYKADQAVHWSFIEGSMFKSKPYMKQFKTKDEYPDLTLAGVNPEKMRKKIGLKKIPGKYEMEVEAERQPMEVDAFAHVSSWTCDQLAQYLREQNLPEKLVKTLEKEQVDGKEAVNFGMEEATELFIAFPKAEAKYDKAMMHACRKYGYDRRKK